jgi:hypothetical protein
MSKRNQKAKTTEANTEVAATEVAAPAAPAVRVAQNQKYTFGANANKANPRTSGLTGQASSTQHAWNAVHACLTANNGVATHDQLAEALKAANLQFKTYVPYFTNRCHWLAYAE